MSAVFILANFRRSYRVDLVDGTVEKLYDFPLDDDRWVIPPDTTPEVTAHAQVLLKKYLKSLDDARAQEERL